MQEAGKGRRPNFREGNWDDSVLKGTRFCNFKTDDGG